MFLLQKPEPCTQNPPLDKPSAGHFRAPALQTPPKFHERIPREREREERKLWREKGKKREMLGPLPFGASTLQGLYPSGPLPFGASTLRGLYPSGPPPFGASALRGLYPSGPHPLWSQNSTSKNWPKSNWPNSKKKAGRSRNWPKSNWPNSKKKLAEVEIGRSRSRSSPLSPPLLPSPPPDDQPMRCAPLLPLSLPPSPDPGSEGPKTRRCAHPPPPGTRSPHSTVEHKHGLCPPLGFQLAFQPNIASQTRAMFDWKAGRSKGGGLGFKGLGFRV